MNYVALEAEDFELEFTPRSRQKRGKTRLVLWSKNLKFCEINITEH